MIDWLIQDTLIQFDNVWLEMWNKKIFKDIWIRLTTTPWKKGFEYGDHTSLKIDKTINDNDFLHLKWMWKKEKKKRKFMLIFLAIKPTYLPSKLWR